jgi:hypothetical protein
MSPFDPSETWPSHLDDGTLPYPSFSLALSVASERCAASDVKSRRRGVDLPGAPLSNRMTALRQQNGATRLHAALIMLAKANKIGQDFGQDWRVSSWEANDAHHGDLCRRGSVARRSFRYLIAPYRRIDARTSPGVASKRRRNIRWK